MRGAGPLTAIALAVGVATGAGCSAADPAAQAEAPTSVPAPTPAPSAVRSSTTPATEAPTTTAPATTTTRPAATPTAVDLCAYRGLGTWVDVYDSEPAFTEGGTAPPVTPADVAAMHEQGVRTLYLQVAKDDPRSPGTITNPERATEFTRAAHARGMHVVAWYLPTHRDHELDVARVEALARFTVDGRHFDGIAVDIEGTDLADVAERNRRLVDLMDRLDRAAGTIPIGSIVYPPVVTDVLNTALWPDFPWHEVARRTDVWLPMAYWTFRDAGSDYRDAHRYVSENVERLRANVGDPAAPVHVIGGIGDTATTADYDGMQRAARDHQALGISVYDFDTMSPSAWPSLRTPSGC